MLLYIRKHQDTFDAQTAKAQGIETVIFRCSYQTNVVDLNA